MMFRSALFLCVCCFGVLVLSCQFEIPQILAEEEKGGSESLFQRLDKNSDGMIEASEVNEAQKRHFERLIRLADNNQDGKLTKSEFEQAIKPQPNPAPSSAPFGQPMGIRNGSARPFNAQSLFQRFDTNKDQKLSLQELPELLRNRFKPLFDKSGKKEITLEEFQRMVPAAMALGTPQQTEERMKQFFNRLDQNKDGKIDLEEVPAGSKPLVQGLLRRLNKQPGDSISREELLKVTVRNQPNPGFRPRFLVTLDTNKDGKLNAEEFAAAKDKFSQLDTNKDGQLDPRELFGRPMGLSNTAANRTTSRSDGKPSSNTDRPKRSMSEENSKRSVADVEQLFKTRDKDGDGKLTGDEIPPKAKNNLERLDRNQDGSLDLEEMRRAVQRREKQNSKAKPGVKKTTGAKKKPLEKK